MLNPTATDACTAASVTPALSSWNTRARYQIMLEHLELLEQYSSPFVSGSKTRLAKRAERIARMKEKQRACTQREQKQHAQMQQERKLQQSERSEREKEKMRSRLTQVAKGRRRQRKKRSSDERKRVKRRRSLNKQRHRQSVTSLKERLVFLLCCM